MRVKSRDLKLNKEYWICDTGMAGCDDNHNNVFKCNLTFKGRILFDCYYIAFTTKKEAIKLSDEIGVDGLTLFGLDEHLNKVES